MEEIFNEVKVNEYKIGSLWRSFYSSIVAWEEAVNLCEDVVGVDSKESLHKFLSLFLLLKDMPIVEAIYISLRFNGTQVSEGYVKTG